jgi:hypothetical protein
MVLGLVFQNEIIFHKSAFCSDHHFLLAMSGHASLFLRHQCHPAVAGGFTAAPQPFSLLLKTAQ